MSESPGVGLRERKRAKTAAAIRTAAVELVLERGLDAATIEAISERADVSTRTFFNYFPSKEDAVLGIDEAAVSAELDRPRETPDDLLDGVFELLYAVFEASGGKPEITERTREAVQRHPQLMTRQMLRIAELEGRLSAIIARWLLGDPRFASGDEKQRLEEAHIILGVCLATVRTSMRRWASGAAAHGASAADPRAAFERSIATLRTVLERVP